MKPPVEARVRCTRSTQLDHGPKGSLPGPKAMIVLPWFSSGDRSYHALFATAAESAGHT